MNAMEHILHMTFVIWELKDYGDFYEVRKSACVLYHTHNHIDFKKNELDKFECKM